jgi:hypothetical protein
MLEGIVPARIAAWAFLLKFSKHLALLACMLLLGRLAGRYDAEPTAILAVVLASAIAHMAGLALKPRLSVRGAPRKRAG